MSALEKFPRVTPFLWFDNNAEEAMKFYLSVFKGNSRKIDIKRKGKEVIATTFQLQGQEFIALNGGPHFKFTEAISLVVRCDSQEEVDDYWAKLSAEGSGDQCGWLKDKFGLSWQIVPSALPQLLTDTDSAKSERAMIALMKMKKFDIETLQRAYAGQD